MSFLEIWGQGFLVIMALMTTLWIVSVFLKNASIVDPFWGFGFVLVNWFYYTQTDGSPARQALILTLVTLWGLRLSLYLGWRNWGKAEDFRYQAFRQKYGPARYWWFSFFQVFLLQGVLMWLISAPLLGAQIYAKNPALGILDWLGIAVWLVGFVFEAGGDWQLTRFMANKANRGKLLTTGLWRYTRHPNYFGDSACWWGYGLICLGGGSFIPVYGSVLMTALIIRVSGVMLLEKSLVDSKPGYADYIRRTSAFLPWPPKR